MAEERCWPEGRVGANDDGEIEVAIALDLPHKIVRIAFPHPVLWFGLNVETARILRDKLSQHIETLEK